MVQYIFIFLDNSFIFKYNFPSRDQQSVLAFIQIKVQISTKSTVSDQVVSSSHSLRQTPPRHKLNNYSSTLQHFQSFQILFVLKMLKTP